MKYPKEIYWYGSENKLKAQKVLSAGPLSMVYENGNLRYIKLGGREVVRMIYSAVRDHNWGTVTPEIYNEKLEVNNNSFNITYECNYQEEQVNFHASYQIEGLADGTINFRMEGEAKSDFRKNRIGFCVLHPVKECVGQDCEVGKVDGTTEKGKFPVAISPHQPYKEIKSIRWPLENKLDAKITFEGDVFEMEDQRNWTDASYKTYSTPLEIPFPVELKAGTRINQQVRLELIGEPVKMKPLSKGDDLIRIEITDQEKPFPDIGIARSSERDLIRTAEMERIRSLAFKHYRVDIRLYDSSWLNIFRNATEEYINFRFPLELILHFGDEIPSEVNAFINIAKELSPYIKTFTIFNRDHKTSRAQMLNAVVPLLRQKFPNIPIGAGTDAYFTELNRERTPTELIDFISYSLNPQVHAFDNDSLTETLEAQSYTVNSAKEIAQGLPVHVSPVTLKPRFNPNATGPEPVPAPGQLPEQVDVRQPSLYAAGWTLGSIKYLAESEAKSITYFETIGRRGIVQGEFPPELNDQFRADRKAIFPMYHVFTEILNFKPDKIKLVSSSKPLLVEAIMISKGEDKRMILANLTGNSQKVEVPWWKEKMHKKVLSDKNADAFIYHNRQPEFEAINKQNRTGKLRMELPPYGIMTLE